MPIEPRNPRTRPVFKLSAIDDQEKFQPLPPPSGAYPYHLDVQQLVQGIDPLKMVFHMAGDTGNLRSVNYQRSVADGMAQQCREAVNDAERPQFLFHLGDVVYNFGQGKEYYGQFFYPYRDYPAPVFAIPGNHDADIDPLEQEKPGTLAAFGKVFCNTEIRPIALAGDTDRQSNIQPNTYFTLQTPLATIIGLYSNVPKFGTIGDEQRDWFVNELKTFATGAKGKALIVCLHHSPYSADTNHGSGIHMQQLLNGAFKEANVWPDIVFSGHVHNYQRFKKTYDNGKVVPFIVSGAGGYSDLHPLAKPGDPLFPDHSPLLDNVELQNYCDHAHGFLKIMLVKEESGLKLSGEYYVIGYDQSAGLTLFDRFEVEIKTATVNKAFHL